MAHSGMQRRVELTSALIYVAVLTALFGQFVFAAWTTFRYPPRPAFIEAVLTWCWRILPGGPIILPTAWGLIAPLVLPVIMLKRFARNEGPLRVSEIILSFGVALTGMAPGVSSLSYLAASLPTLRYHRWQFICLYGFPAIIFLIGAGSTIYACIDAVRAEAKPHALTRSAREKRLEILISINFLTVPALLLSLLSSIR